MYSSQGRSRRQRGGADSVSDPSWASGTRGDTYSHPGRSSQQSGSYVTPPSPQAEYETRRQRPSSRGRSDAWRRADDGRSPADVYSMPSATPDFQHENREEHHDIEHRDAGWPAKDPSSGTSGRQRVESFDKDPSTGSHQESASWAPPAQTENRTSDFGWTPETSRRAQRAERNNRYRSDDRRGEGRRDKDTRKQNGRDDWRIRDDGWESRPPPESSSNPSRHRTNPTEKVESTNEDRVEPASSWHQNHRGTQNQRNQHSFGNKNNNNKGGKGGKKQYNNNNNNNNNNKQRRDWRTDDGQLNNWTRRDPNGSYKNSRGTGKRRQQRSPSPPRGRSRSPAESYYSRRSSRGRSPSYETPKRRRLRERSPSGRSRSPLPRPRDKQARQPQRWSRSPSVSPRSPRSVDSRGFARSRARSISSATTSSRSRSPSQSPRQRARTVHRLPVTTTVKDIPFPLNNTNRSPNKRTNRQQPHRGNKGFHAPSDAATSGRGPIRDLSPSQLLSEHTAREHRGYGYLLEDRPGSSEVMPPPVSVHPLSGPRRSPSPVQQPSRMSPSDHRYKPVSRISRNAGFKPIGRPSSAVKKFFPDDDDEQEESHSHLHESSSTRAHSDFGGESSSAIPSMSNGKDSAHHHAASRFHEMQEAPLLNSRGSDVPTSMVGSNGAQHDEMALYDDATVADIPTAAPSGAQDLEPETLTPTTRAPSPSRGAREELYAIVSQVGEGTFGKVYKARNTMNGRFVALKRIRMEAERDGFPVTAMREIKLLQSLRHDNVVRLYEMMVSNGSVYMVFQYMDHDLTGILSQTQFSFTDAHLKSFCQQMLAGLAYLHHKGVIHRDIKGSNILINNQGELKLADFGLARFYQKRRRSDYTNRVITLWYRPPELLFGTTVYGPEVDMWSAGCIMLELFTKKPVFQGNDEIHQLDVIYKVLGTPTVERWSDMTNLPWYELVKPKEVIPNYFRAAFQKWLSPAGLDLAERLLAYDPAQRVTAAQALDAPYFHQEEPPAAAPTGLSSLEGEWHELETKRERAKKRKRPEGASQ